VFKLTTPNDTTKYRLQSILVLGEFNFKQFIKNIVIQFNNNNIERINGNSLATYPITVELGLAILPRTIKLRPSTIARQ
jgi:hypothetical protein